REVLIRAPLPLVSATLLAVAAGSAQTAQTPADHLRAGQQYQRQGRLQEAEAEYRKTVDLDPDDADTASLYGHVLLGQLCSARGDYACAIAQLQRALRRDPTLARAHYFLGITFTLDGQKEKAVPELTEAARIEPQNAAFQYYLGLAL